MTRQEQILAASMSHADKAWKGEHEHVAFKTITMADFSAGAMWTDQHPHWIPVEDSPYIHVVFCKGRNGWVPFTGYGCNIDTQTTVKFINCINDATDVLNGKEGKK